MVRIIKYIFLIVTLIAVYSFIKPAYDNIINTKQIIQDGSLDGNNINSWIWNTGVFDADFSITNKPGFEWPKFSNQYAIFSAGLCIAAYINNELRMSSASYKGEYAGGYISIINGVPVAMTDSRFRIYKVRRGDNANTNPDWYYWGYMVTYGAPFIDANHNGFYEPFIDTPGVKDAEQTIFACMTDGFTDRHQVGEGFGGGTSPMFNELHFTAWCYSVSFLRDVQFIKWDIINKSLSQWNNTYLTVFCDPDLGCANDDYMGCDTIRQLGYCYNGEDLDCQSLYRYNGIPPAVGIQWLNCSGVINSGIKSFIEICSWGGHPRPVCEEEAYGEQVGAYNFMRGLKKDETPYVIPPGGQQNVTKFLYTGDPETGLGWTEGPPGNPIGSVWNCGGPDHYTGDIHSPNSFDNREFCMSTGGDNYIVHSGDTVKVMIAQLIAQGTSRLNSVTKLKHLSDSVKMFCNGGFVIGTEQISSNIPDKFILYQNYPNPFNPGTKIKFSIPFLPLAKGEVEGVNNVQLKVYDVLGREVASLVNEKLQPGTYSVDWDATNYPSGVYFYKLSYGDFNQTKKMVLIK